ncbi:MAG: FAD-dependent oxidoreductase [Acidobacteriota bacterium]|nr:FAD-dependent oxidoreductase [Acidobacteriota bacterium]
MGKILVLGAGIIGLSTAVRLQEEGHSVEILARSLPMETTSAIAAAIWLPYRAEPAEKIARWSAQTYRRYAVEARDPASGVQLVELRKIARRELVDPYWLRPEYPSRRLSSDELPPGYEDGMAVRVPFIPSNRYLPWLLDRFRAAGGTVTVGEVGSLEELPQEPEAVVCCVGLGARELVGDDSLFPIRGQLVRLRSPSSPAQEIPPYVGDETSFEDPVYILPRGSECILGGTAQPGEGDLAPDPQTQERILARCFEIAPELRGWKVDGALVGLRPGRPSVRLEREVLHGRPVIFNYGHGGSGFTVAWGCADEVVELLGESLPE